MLSASDAAIAAAGAGVPAPALGHCFDFALAFARAEASLGGMTAFAAANCPRTERL